MERWVEVGEEGGKRRTDVARIHASTFDAEYVKVPVCYPVEGEPK